MHYDLQVRMLEQEDGNCCKQAPPQQEQRAVEPCQRLSISVFCIDSATPKKEMQNSSNLVLFNID